MTNITLTIATPTLRLVQGFAWVVVAEGAEPMGTSRTR